jgi:hypothetical protein
MRRLSTSVATVTKEDLIEYDLSNTLILSQLEIIQGNRIRVQICRPQEIDFLVHHFQYHGSVTHRHPGQH